jgi:hypothetical protein
MSEILKGRSGKPAKLIKQTKGVLIEGDGLTPLANNAWFKIVARAAVGSTLPDFAVGKIFKSPDSGNAITPIAGDKVYPLTLEQICKGDVASSSESETVDITDDCANGYNKNIPAGFATVAGSFAGFFKFKETDEDLPAAQEDILNRGYDIDTDDGAGTYTELPKKDDEILLAILRNSDSTDVDKWQIWQFLPAVVTTITTDAPLKGGQNFDVAFTKGNDPVQFYKRKTNSEETVF